MEASIWSSAAARNTYVFTTTATTNTVSYLPAAYFSVSPCKPSNPTSVTVTQSSCFASPACGPAATSAFSDFSDADLLKHAARVAAVPAAAALGWTSWYNTGCSQCMADFSLQRAGQRRWPGVQLAQRRRSCAECDGLAAGRLRKSGDVMIRSSNTVLCVTHFNCF